MSDSEIPSISKLFVAVNTKKNTYTIFREWRSGLVDTDSGGHQLSLAGYYRVTGYSIADHIATWQWFSTCSNVCRWLHSFHRLESPASLCHTAEFDAIVRVCYCSTM